MNRAAYFGRPRIVRVFGAIIALWFLHYLFFAGSWEPAPNNINTEATSKDGSPTWTLVVASKSGEDSAWIKKELPDVNSAVYIVDDAKSKLKVPAVKGNEAMVFLTYIIDHYDSLSDVSVFIHTHQRARYTDEFLDSSMVKSLQRLRLTKVLRDGYFNLRCSWDPGCPVWLNLRNSSASAPEVDAGEAEIMRSAWREILPAASIPEWVAQPAGSQFAASREKIRSLPLGLWKAWRNWLITTPLTDLQASRVWEFLWQYALLGRSSVCPQMDECYCEGYGVCFTSPTKFIVWRSWWREAQDWSLKYLKYSPRSREASQLKEKIDARNEVLRISLQEAMRWGDELRDRGEEHLHVGHKFTEEEEKAMYST